MSDQANASVGGTGDGATALAGSNGGSSESGVQGQESGAGGASTTADPLAGLKGYFESQETAGNQVDNSGSNDSGQQSADGGQQAEETPTEQTTEGDTTDDQTAAADETGTGEGEASTEADAQAGSEAVEETEGSADFDALSSEPGEILDTFDAVKAKFPRNSPTELVKEMARYGEIAKRGQEVITAIGGEAFIPGMTKISESLRAGDPVQTFQNIGETAGLDQMVKMMGEAIYIGIAQNETMQANPQQKPLADALTGMIDFSLKERFGPEMSLEKMAKLADWDAAGWFDKIEKAVSEDYFDADEWRESLEASKNPTLLAAIKQTQELKRQLDEKKTKADTTSANAAGNTAQVDSSFDTLATDSIGKAFNDVVLKNSVLRDTDTDTPEIKEEKALLRETLTTAAIANFRASDDYKKLVEDNRNGKRETAAFKSQLTTALNTSILGTQKQTATAERILAKNLGKTRNVNLGQKAKAASAATSAAATQGGTSAQASQQTTNTGQQQPTETTDFSRGQKPTRDQIVKNLSDRLGELG